MFGFKKEIRWYISGAVSSDPNYREKFSKAEKEFKKMGYKVLNPVKGEKEGKPWRYYLTKDIIKMLRKCRGLIMLPDWNQSAGAQLERKIALALHFKVLYYYPILGGVADEKGNWA